MVFLMVSEKQVSHAVVACYNNASLRYRVSNCLLCLHLFGKDATDIGFHGEYLHN